MEYTSRSRRLYMQIEDFLENNNRTSLHVSLYGSEISKLRKKYSEIEIQEGSILRNQCIMCVITKK